MLKKDKIITFLLLVLLGVLIFVIFNLKDRDRQYEREIMALEKRFEIFSGTKATLEHILIRAVRKNRQYKVSLENEIKRRESLDEQLKILFTEISAAKSDLNDLEDKNHVLQTKTGQLQQENNFLNGQISHFKQMQENLQLKIKRLLMRTKVELGKVVVTPSSLNGKVLKANKLYNFIIIDLGKNDGIKAGMSLIAYRGDSRIGEIIIEKAYDELSVGKAAFEWVGDEMGAGDIVKGKE